MPISKKNKVHIDSRGSLHECMNIGGELSDVPIGGHLYAFTIQPKNSRRGNVTAHYTTPSIPEVQEVVNEINGISFNSVLNR